MRVIYKLYPWNGPLLRSNVLNSYTDLGNGKRRLSNIRFLRTLITEIISRMRSDNDQNRRVLITDQALLRTIERVVSEQVNQASQPNMSANFHQTVDQIQSDLESLIGGNESGDAPREQ